MYFQVIHSDRFANRKVFQTEFLSEMFSAKLHRSFIRAENNLKNCISFGNYDCRKQNNEKIRNKKNMAVSDHALTENVLKIKAITKRIMGVLL